MWAFVAGVPRAELICDELDVEGDGLRALVSEQIAGMCSGRRAPEEGQKLASHCDAGVSRLPAGHRSDNDRAASMFKRMPGAWKDGEVPADRGRLGAQWRAGAVRAWGWPRPT